MSGCGIKKVVPEGKSLLVKNKVIGDKPIGGIAGQIRHKPNSKFLGLARVRLHLYKYGKHSKIVPKKLRERWMNKVGEEPKLVDSPYVKNSADQLQQYLFNNGYFYATVDYEIKQRWYSKRRAVVSYRINADSVWTIKHTDFQTVQRNISGILERTQDDSYVVEGEPFRMKDLQRERERITDRLKNEGFYNFNKQYVEFQVDTSLTGKEVQVSTIVQPKNNMSDHQIYQIGEVKVMIGEYGQPFDTANSLFYEGLSIDLNGYKLRPYVLKENIFLLPGERYSYKKQSSTYNRLMNLGIFSRVNIVFEPIDSMSSLNVNIYLSTRSRHEFIWEPQLISTEQNSGIVEDRNRNYGLGNNFILRNKNIFGNGEQLNLSTNTSFETQLKRDSLQSLSNFRQNVSVELIEPRLLLLSKFTGFLSITRPKTKVNMSYIYEDNANFTRNVFPLNYTYTFGMNEFDWFITPLQISYNRARVSDEFINSLSPANLRYVQQVLRNNLIIGPKVGFTYSDARYKDDHNFRLAVNAFEISGTTPRIVDRLNGNTAQQQTLLGVTYSQYTKTDVDMVFYEKVGEKNLFVFRVFAGLAMPYGNSVAVPFERRYFVGGNNSLRAWRPRSIGPGGFVDAENSGIAVDKTGEVLLQNNVEYRFNINGGALNGAIFSDLGNIWLTRPDESFPDGAFKAGEFYQQLAWNTGMGIRYDLDFFIIRADWGLPLYDPSRTDGWVASQLADWSFLTGNSVINLAVGYPF
jgi:outer membrane protein assembly factor BamA